MYLPNFLDGFDRLVAFDTEMNGKRTTEMSCYPAAQEISSICADYLVERRGFREPAGIAGIFLIRETPSVCRDCVVVDAVPQNRSRSREFPANGKRTGNLQKICTSRRILSQIAM
jgi:hypothetical protein